MNGPAFRTSPCRGCGHPIVWLSTDTGKVPLDPRAPVYTVVDDGQGGAKGERAGDTLTRYMVSHFATCANANDFSRGKRKAQEVLNP